MQLNVSVSHGKGGTGHMFQIDSVQDAETGVHLTESLGIDVGRHFDDGEEHGDYLREKAGSNVNFEIVGDHEQDD